MKLKIALIILTALGILRTSGEQLGKTDKDNIPIFKIDLILEPKERFKETTLHFKNEIEKLFELYDEIIGNALIYMFKIVDFVTFDTSSDRYQEQEGIAEVLDIPTHKVVMLNHLYELDAWCTSLVARMNNGSLMMARNLDFYFPEDMRKALYIGKFYRGDTYLFEATSFGGLVDIYTGMKPKAFSISVNERTSKTSRTNLLANLIYLFGGYKSVGMLVRKALTECSDFNCASKVVSS